MPDGCVGRTAVRPYEGNLTFLSCSVKEKRNGGVFADVFSDVLFSVICPHLFLVNVFLEDVTEYVGVDFVIGAQGAFIQMPLILVKEFEYLFKSSVCDLNMFAVQFFNLVTQEQATVKIGDFTKKLVC